MVAGGTRESKEGFKRDWIEECGHRGERDCRGRGTKTNHHNKGRRSAHAHKTYDRARERTGRQSKRATINKRQATGHTTATKLSITTFHTRMGHTVGRNIMEGATIYTSSIKELVGVGAPTVAAKGVI